MGHILAELRKIGLIIEIPVCDCYLYWPCQYRHMAGSNLIDLAPASYRACSNLKSFL